MLILSVIPLLNGLDDVFYYTSGKLNVSIGDLLLIPFGKKQLKGICIDISTNKTKINDKIKIKDIEGIIYKNILNPNTISFLKHFTEYNYNSLSNTLKMSITDQITSDRAIFLLNKYKIKADCKFESILKEEIKNKKRRDNIINVCNFIKKNSPISGIRLEEQFTNIIVSKAINTAQEAGIVILEKSNNKTQNKDIEFVLQSLNEMQKEVFDQICNNIEDFKTHLIHGITGSGKTQLYCHVVKKILEKNPDGQVLIMLPEISMTNEIAKRIRQIIKGEIVLWHSSLTSAEKIKYISKIINNEIKIIIGTRSSVMLPYKNLKGIVVDEEHDSSYKQDNNPTYNAKNMAVLRGSVGKIPVLLCSATPSMESYYNAYVLKKYSLHQLLSRHGGAAMPDIEIVDMSQKNVLSKGHYIAKEVKKLIIQELSGENQILIFLNRKGYRRMIECSSCSYIKQCTNCDNFLTYYKKKQILQCHYCKNKIPIPIECDECKNSNTWKESGSVGIEKITEEVRQTISDTAKIAVLSGDNSSDLEEVQNTIKAIEDNEIDIIIGTQVISKGYNFKNLTLAIALDINANNVDGDYRIFEKIYQNIVQVAGRSGRFAKKGKMIIQTKYPDHRVLQTILSTKHDSFYLSEIKEREKANLPPVIKEVSIIVSSEKDEEAQKAIMDLYKNIIQQKKTTQYFDIIVLGPIPNVVHYMKRQYRHRITLRNKYQAKIRKFLSEILPIIKSRHRKVYIKIDIDPISFI